LLERLEPVAPWVRGHDSDRTHEDLPSIVRPLQSLDEASRGGRLPVPRVSDEPADPAVPQFEQFPFGEFLLAVHQSCPRLSRTAGEAGVVAGELRREHDDGNTDQEQDAIAGKLPPPRPGVPRVDPGDDRDGREQNDEH
jgi:hypothetical protein